MQGEAEVFATSKATRIVLLVLACLFAAFAVGLVVSERSWPAVVAAIGLSVVAVRALRSWAVTAGGFSPSTSTSTRSIGWSCSWSNGSRLPP